MGLGSSAVRKAGITLVLLAVAFSVIVIAVAETQKRATSKQEKFIESNGLTEVGNSLTCNSLMQQIAHFAPACTKRSNNVFMFHDDFNHDTSSLYIMNQFHSRGSGAKWVWKKDGTLESDNTNSDLGLRVNPVILPQNIKSIVVTSEYLGTRDDDFSGIMIYDANRSNIWMCGISNDYPNRRSKRRTGTNSGIIRSSSLTNDNYSMVQTGPNKDVKQPHTFRVEYKQGMLEFYVDSQFHSRSNADIDVSSFGIVSIAQSPPSKWKSLSAVIIHEDGGNRVVLTDPVHAAEKLCIGPTCLSEGSLRAVAILGGMLDGFPSSAGVGYGVRRLYSSYNGPMLQVRNSDTGGHTDVYTNAKGDVVALSAGASTLNDWLGSADAVITQWYNQGSAQNVPALTPRGGSSARLSLSGGNRVMGVRFENNGYYTSNLYPRYLSNNYGGDMSMEAMFYPTSTHGSQYITGDNNQNEAQIIFRPGRISVVYAPWGRSTLHHHMDTPLNTWYYVVFTHGRDKMFRMYVNGSLVQSTRNTFRTSHRHYGPEGRIRVGQRFRGVLGALTVLDSVMTEEEVRSRYTHAFSSMHGTEDGVDATQRPLSEVIVGNELRVNSIPRNEWMRGYIHLPRFYRLSYELYIHGTVSNWGQIVRFNPNPDTRQNYPRPIAHWLTRGGQRIHAKASNERSRNRGPNTSSLPRGTWIQVAIEMAPHSSRDHAYRIYIDGTQVHESLSSSSNIYGKMYVWIGADTGGRYTPADVSLRNMQLQPIFDKHYLSADGDAHHAGRLCLGDTCIGERDLKKVLAGGGGTSGALLSAADNSTSRAYGGSTYHVFEFKQTGRTSSTYQGSTRRFDIFLVGGGAGGSGNGGGGGYTTTVRNVTISKGDVVTVYVGRGGRGRIWHGRGSIEEGTNGEDTWVQVSGDRYEAKGGNVDGSGGSGGANGTSGGGCGGGLSSGGWNGRNGGDGSTSGRDRSRGPSGQGSTTRAFEESDGQLFAGGGGSHRCGHWGGSGGNGGGGRGGGPDPEDGEPNTGGGGGGGRWTKGIERGSPPHTAGNGGSGIVIMRYQ